MPAVTSGVLAELIGVSRQTITNYARAGMPRCGENAESHPLYDSEACKDWVARNKPKTPRGGKREGAGRPPSAAGAGGAADGQGDEDGTVAVSSVEDIIRLLQTKSLTPLKADNLNRVLQAAQRQVDLDKARGLLINAEEAKVAWGHALETVKRQMEALAARLAGRIVQALDVPQTRESDVRTMIADEVRRLCGLLAADPLGQKKVDEAAA